MKSIIKYWNTEKNGLTLTIGTFNDKICYLGLQNDEITTWFDNHKFILEHQPSLLPSEITQLLDDFFAKKPLQLTLDNFYLTGSEFQKKVWNELIKIKAGETITYSDLAQKINHPTAARAVASAVGKNPILLLIPCHRVIGKNNNLYKFRSGGEIKKQLLNFENNN
ncbi:methylated-DNA--[protein]-cysteine S-methyltransferase [Spiroplasma eriocheiris]|uniref:methylated-DNA--[protein]-cysteine S-methyltransferase n=1 Tax=Spiroplasma eriocheiris TaxID=315358 RepID=A0A0H3XMD3_9MOLU|nr:methylated-DNA--[protein]-cysteine S-methyltransferase [Spiroplasma eriocheiris]AHF58339.1 methylated DNA-protein cysteine methyltransferase [Spiroplasma eriocheiris CCTCC M 207170]AKM54774.1 methylated-DNA--protein-cysteine S-methyltransferase [Spiroplasma eriocheiris]